MSYRAEKQRIRRNILDNHYQANTGTDLEILRGIKKELNAQRENHEELIRHSWETQDDPGSILEMWLFIMADLKKIIERYEESA